MYENTHKQPFAISRPLLSGLSSTAKDGDNNAAYSREANPFNMALIFAVVMFFRHNTLSLLAVEKKSVLAAYELCSPILVPVDGEGQLGGRLRHPTTCHV